MAYINSKKYGSAVQLYKKANKDTSYYITYKDEYNKLKRIKIGDKSQGITEPFCKRKRDEVLNKLRLGEDIPIKHKKEKITTIGDLAKIYFEDKDLENKQNKRMQGKYNLHLKENFDDKNIKYFTRDDVIQLRNFLMKKGKENATINGRLKVKRMEECL